MKIQENNGSIKLWLSQKDTYLWALNTAWPCSQLSGKRLFVEFAPNGDLIDISINNGSTRDCDNNELTAITSDFIRAKFPLSPAIKN